MVGGIEEILLKLIDNICNEPSRESILGNVDRLLRSTFKFSSTSKLTIVSGRHSKLLLERFNFFNLDRFPMVSGRFFILLRDKSRTSSMTKLPIVSGIHLIRFLAKNSF